jgi:hypothetical protein
MAVYRIMSVRMQAFAEGTFRLLPTIDRELKNNAIPKEENKSAVDIQRVQDLDIGRYLATTGDRCRPGGLSRLSPQAKLGKGFPSFDSSSTGIFSARIPILRIQPHTATCCLPTE